MSPEQNKNNETKELKEVKNLNVSIKELENAIGEAKAGNVDINHAIKFDSKTNSVLLRGFKSEGDTLFSNEGDDNTIKIDKKDIDGETVYTLYFKDGKYFSKDNTGKLIEEKFWKEDKGVKITNQVESMTNYIKSLCLNQKLKSKEVNSLSSSIKELEDTIGEAKAGNVDINHAIKFDSKTNSVLLRGFKSEGDTLFSNEGDDNTIKIDKKDIDGETVYTLYFKDGKYFSKDNTGNLVEEKFWKDDKGEQITNQIKNMTNYIEDLCLEQSINN